MKKAKRILLSPLVFAIAYVASYVPLSLNGGWVVAESGENRILLAVADTFEWQPRFGYLHRMKSAGGDYRLHGDPVGYFYSPLILFDQKWAHSTIQFIDKDLSLVSPGPAPPLEEYHPVKVNRFHGRFPYEPVQK